MGVKNIKKLLAPLVICIFIMLTISGVSAENFDDMSSVVTESPVSADLDTSLSSCNAQNNELSSCYGSSDSSGWKHSYESSQSQVTGNSYNYGDYGLSYSHDSYISYGNVEYYDTIDNQLAFESCDSMVGCDLDDSYVSLESLNLSQINEINHEFDVGDLTSSVNSVDKDVILKNYDDFSKCEVVINSTNYLDEINIRDSNLQYLTQYDNVIDVNTNDSIMSEANVNIETSENNRFGGDITPQEYNLLKFTDYDEILAWITSELSKFNQISEPVFDCILVSSGYISTDEVYFGTISEKDCNMLLEYVDAVNVIMFANLEEIYNLSVTLEALKNVNLSGINVEINRNGYKFADALLKYYPLTNEVYISLISEGDNGDEHNHIINDTNSHGLDYAYNKHVNVIYKDMPNLLVLTSSGYVSYENSTAGSWDSLNDVLGYSMSSETLLPDHKAIWTPLLLLLQQDLQESIVNSHADDNENKKINTTKIGDTNNKNSLIHTNCSNKTHIKGWLHHYPKYWNHHYSRYLGHNRFHPHYCGGYTTTNVVTTADLKKNSHDNSTDDKKNKSSNVTATSKKLKSSGSPKTPVKGSEPTYTLVYAIIGIVLVSVLFNSSYMRRDD